MYVRICTYICTTFAHINLSFLLFGYVVCIDICVSACVYECGNMWVQECGLCMYGDQRLTFGIYLDHSPLCFLSQPLLSNLELVHQVSLASQVALGISLASLALGLQMDSMAAWGGCWGFRILSPW